MSLKTFVPGLVSAAGAAVLLAAPVAAYESPAPSGAVSAAGATLPETTAAQPATGIDPIVIVGATAGGGLILLSGLGFAYRRRR